MKQLMFWPLILFTLYSCSIIKTQKENPIQPGIVNITGQIEDFNKSSITGRLYYFDAVTRLNKSEVFSIDSSGFFDISFQIAHPTKTVYLQTERTGCSIYAEPNKNYSIIIDKNGKCTFTGNNCGVNNHIIELETAIQSEFKDDINKRNRYHNSDTVEYTEFEKYCLDLSIKQLQFVDEYCLHNLISDEAIEIVVQSIKYEPAWALIVYRWDFSINPAQKRKGLPKNFYINLYKKFPINNPKAIGCKNYNDYIANIKDVIREELMFSKQLMDYYRDANVFSEDELILLKKVYNGDTSASKSQEFNKFLDEKGDVENILFRKANIKKLVEATTHLPYGIGRDLVISQGISNYCFQAPYISPSQEEWNQINSLLSNKNIYNELIRVNNFFQAKLIQPINDSITVLHPPLKDEADEIFEYLIGKYSGKVIYIDFWSTWCGPCRDEIPFSKVLSNHFDGQDLIFLNLCCRSNKESWEKLIKVEQMTGDHYLLRFDEYNYFTQMMDIQGLPTYVLVDKNGEIIDKNAPRPSSGKIIINKIESLLSN